MCLVWLVKYVAVFFYARNRRKRLVREEEAAGNPAEPPTRASWRARALRPSHPQGSLLPALSSSPTAKHKPALPSRRAQHSHSIRARTRAHGRGRHRKKGRPQTQGADRGPESQPLAKVATPSWDKGEARRVAPGALCWVGESGAGPGQVGAGPPGPCGENSRVIGVCSARGDVSSFAGVTKGGLSFVLRNLAHTA